MNDEEKRNAHAGLGLLAVASFLLSGAVLIGCQLGERQMKQEAVDKNHARWIADQKSSHVHFEWLPTKVEAEVKSKP